MVSCIEQVAIDLNKLSENCERRKLKDATKWATELLSAFPDDLEIDGEIDHTSVYGGDLSFRESKTLRFVYALFDQQEFQRAVHLTQDWSQIVRNPRSGGKKPNPAPFLLHPARPLLSFLHYYARYLAGEKERLDNVSDVLDKTQRMNNKEADALIQDLRELKRLAAEAKTKSGGNINSVASPPVDEESMEDETGRNSNNTGIIHVDRSVSAVDMMLSGDGDGDASGISSMPDPAARRRSSHLSPDFVFDQYHSYLLAVIYKDMRLLDRARKELVECIHIDPLFWPAWRELASGIRSRADLQSGLPPLPKSWMRDLFHLEAYGRLQMYGESIQLISDVFSGKMTSNNEQVDNPLGQSNFVQCHYAVALFLAQDLDGARAVFQEISKRSPYRMEHQSEFANTLFVLAESLDDARIELCVLAKKCHKIDRYSAETCLVIGNYYSMNKEHEKAVLYFQRAVKLDPHNPSTYTLMGHEFLSLKNTPAAILAYRHALDIDPNDCRAWNGLGNSYEYLTMPSYAYFYYMRAHKAKPEDSRFLEAMGDMCEMKGELEDARACFWRAHVIGDRDGRAVYKLGCIYEKMPGKDNEAASCHWKYLKSAAEMNETDEFTEAHSYKFLVQHAYKQKKWDATIAFAQCCLKYDQTRPTGKHYLQLASKEKTKNSEPGASDDSNSASTGAAADTAAADLGLSNDNQGGDSSSLASLNQDSESRLENMTGNGGDDSEMMMDESGMRIE